MDTTERAAAPAAPMDVADEERRLFERVPYRRRCLLSRPGSSMSYPAMSVDLSAGGVGLFLTQDIDTLKARDLVLSFAADADGPALQRVVRLVYTNCFSQGTSFAGARFIDPLTYDEIADLLG